MPSSHSIASKSLLTASALVLAAGIAPPSWAQIIGTPADNNRNLQLAPDSPYHDPDIIYLEADELISSESNNVLTAVGEVEGRYQDRTLRADRVVYNLENGRIVATGNVTLIDSSGSAQFADKLELSGELEAGTASDFTSRLANGGTTGAKLAARRTDGGIDLYNAYYTACEVCEDSTKKPTWQLKARRVSQDKERNMIRYNDARFEFLGVPVFYTPYLAHPDPTVDRASGWLTPSFGISNTRGVNAELPYYVALDDYSEITLKPRLFSKVRPILGTEYRRKFHTGEVNIDASFGYDDVFDSDGDAFISAEQFNNQDEALLGTRLRSHFFGDGIFKINEDWDWGFSGRVVSDDLYLDRYGLDTPRKFGLIDGDSRRLTSQAFVLGQNDTFRFSTAAFGFQSLRTTIREEIDPNTDFEYLITREDDSTLPIAAPKIELNKFFTDPVVGGRLQAFGDVSVLSRKVGTDYARGTAGLNWNKTFIAPGGIEAKPFGEVRYDYFEFEPDPIDDSSTVESSQFDRAIGQVGMDIRWPFVKSTNNVDIIVEPRAQITQNFGDGGVSNFTTTDSEGREISLIQDSIGIDLDDSLFWSSNKSTGYDFWQEGFRADVGGSVSAIWEDSSASLFLGQSFASGYDDEFSSVSGLGRLETTILNSDTNQEETVLLADADRSDLVGAFDLNIKGNFNLATRARYDDDQDKFTRIDTSLSYNSRYFDTDWRYYKIDDSLTGLIDDPLVPNEEISGSVTVHFLENWSARYRVSRDIDADVNRRQSLGLIYNDDCTMVELTYEKQDFDNDAIRNSDGIRLRFSLLTLGDFESN